MGLDTRATDWQACGVVTVAGGDVLGAGLFVFDFYSEAAGLTARFTFKGVGIGAGGNAGGTTVGDIGPYTSFTALTVKNAFNVWDLNGAWGRVGSFGAGIGLSYGIVTVCAAPPWSWGDAKAFFTPQNVGGFGTGLGAGGVWVAGNWRFKKVSGNRPSSPTDSMA